MQVRTPEVEKAGTTDPKKVMDTIKGGAWDTVIGKMEFDAKGDIKQIDYVVYKWDAKGNYTEINPKGSCDARFDRENLPPRFAGAFLFAAPALDKVDLSAGLRSSPTA